MPTFDLGESIPPDTAHAVSVSLPTWSANIGYEEGQQWVVSKMTTGYPRFFIHKIIAAFADAIVAKYGQPGQTAVLFPTSRVAQRCVAFMQQYAPPALLGGLRVLQLTVPESKAGSSPQPVSTSVSAVLCSLDAFPYAKQYWQHSGDGVSSRRAEFCHGLFKEGLLVPDEPSPRSPPPKQSKGPRRYQRPTSMNGLDSPPSPPTASSAANGTNGANQNDSEESSRFLEERFGRNLDLSFVERAKSAIRRRIAGAIDVDIEVEAQTAGLPHVQNSRGVKNMREDDIYLLPCGMNAIFNAHRILLSAHGDNQLKSINFGFPYVDTLKILQKFGPGCLFLGHASDAELDELEVLLEKGERFLGLFCEFPGNPLLTCPNLARIRSLADKYDFAVVIDDTIGTFANINIMPFADIVVSSLTKIFSGDCNVMGGSAILNPAGRYYDALKATAAREIEDTYWAEDVIFMERNSRDFGSRVDRINANADAVCDLLLTYPLVREVYYPRLSPQRTNYEACKLPSGGYGGVLSVVFREKKCAVAFYDAIETAKGPSLGTNFTITSPYVLLAHYAELDWAKGLGVDPDLLRISIGLEETDELIAVLKKALSVAEQADVE